MDYTFIVDVAKHVAELAKERHPTAHIQGRAIFTDDHVKVLAFPFDAGHALEDDTAPHPAMLHFV